jgi:peptidyl-prolyl cis-trans isomerase SurA
MRFDAKLKAFLLGLILFGTRPAPATAAAVLLDRIVAEVNGETITLSEVAERVERLEREMRGTATDAEAFEKQMQSQRANALQTMIDELIVLQEGKRLGVEVTEDDIDRAVANVKRDNNVTSDAQFQYMLQSQSFTLDDYREFLRRQMSIIQTRRKALSGVEITDEEIKAYYEANKQDFLRPPSVHLRHILFRIPENATPSDTDAIQRKAQAVLAELNGGAKFIDLALRYSEDPSASKGGDIGTISRGQMLPEFEAVAFELPVGQVSEPVRTKYGFHLIQVVERAEGNYQPLNEISQKLREFLQEKRAQGKYQEWIEKLRDQAYVKIYERPAVQ